MRETRFKDSEIGLIPEDWEVKRLGDMCHLQNGFAFPSSSFGDIGKTVIRISDINNLSVNVCNSVKSTSEVPEQFKLRKGDMLIAMSGATTGKIGVFDSDIEAYINQRVGRFDVNSALDRSFLLCYLQSDFFDAFLTNELVAGAQPNISSTQIENLKVIFPSLIEQKRIASALSDVDGLLREFFHILDI